MEEEPKKSNATTSIVILMVVIIAAGIVYAVVNKNATKRNLPAEVTTPTNIPTNIPTNMPTSGAVKESGSVSSAKEFTVIGTSFAFSPKEIRVKKGDAVKVTFENNKGVHDFVIDELNVRTKVINAGEKETVEFTADKTGTFEYYCSVGNHRKMGMVGSLIVE